MRDANQHTEKMMCKYKSIFFFFILFFLLKSQNVFSQNISGRLANSGFEDERIKATVFFSGQARDNSSFPYGCLVTPFSQYYTVHTVDDRHQKWSDSLANRQFAVDTISDAGLNVIVMSIWGESYYSCSESPWVYFAAMQQAPESHEELFEVSLGKPVMIMPMIESYNADPHKYAFYDDFPIDSNGQVAPRLTSLILDTVDRFLTRPANPAWADKWARVYDTNGEERYAISLIHCSSNRLSPADHADFAAGFGNVAQEVFNLTGFKIGFFIDALPANTGAPGIYKTIPELSGPYLASEPAVLGIMSYLPEIWSPISNDTTEEMIAWKQDYSSRWSATDVPFLMDIAPGYDAHLVGPGSRQYGHNSAWLSGQTDMVRDFGDDGLMYNFWNGYTEGLCGPPTVEYGDTYYTWLQSMLFHKADFNKDGIVDLSDLSTMVSAWLDNNLIEENVLVCQYEFEEGVGSVATDSSGNGYNGTITGASWVSGHDGGYALDFEGSDYISFTTSVVEQMFSTIDDQITISFWQHGDELIQPQADYLFQGSNPTRSHLLVCHLPWDRGEVYWFAGQEDDTADQIMQIAETSAYEGQWNHWAFTKNTSTGSMKIYLNGSLWHSGTGGESMAGITTFVLGASANNDGNYDGIIDDFCIYNKELDTDDIMRVYQGLDPLLKYTCIEKPSGEITNDCSVNLSDFSLLGTCWQETGYYLGAK